MPELDLTNAGNGTDLEDEEEKEEEEDDDDDGELPYSEDLPEVQQYYQQVEALKCKQKKICKVQQCHGSIVYHDDHSDEPDICTSEIESDISNSLGYLKNSRLKDFLVSVY